MVDIKKVAQNGRLLNDETIAQSLDEGLSGKYSGQKVLVLIPDHTRTAPLPMLFRILVEVLGDTSRLDFMVALGTHPPLNEELLNQLVGITPEERVDQFSHVGLLNHEWDNPTSLTQIATLPKSQVQDIAGKVWHPSLGGDVPVRINRKVMDYDHVLIVGPTFPHEVVGFSGGAKYLFPGISGPEMIDVTHWLGALGGVQQTIGLKETPIRKMIHAAAKHLPVAVTLIALVVVGEGLGGIFIGDPISAWEAAADLSAERHIQWCEKPFRRVLAKPTRMYDELWTAAKAMYKSEAVVADGGELIIYAPHLKEISFTHGKYIYEIGYHVAEYFLKQWDKFEDIPLSVLAHSTHVKGAGEYREGVEFPRINVVLASQVTEPDCEQLNLTYMDPNLINESEWINKEAEGLLYVAEAGEMLYRLRE